MFGIGSTEFLVIIVVALLVLGPEHLPKVMRTVGKTMADFRRITTDFQRTINTESAMEEERRRKQEERAARPKKKKRPEAKPENQAPADADANAAGEVIVTTAEGSGSASAAPQENTGDAQV